MALAEIDVAKTQALLTQWGAVFTYSGNGGNSSFTAYASEQTAEFQDSNGAILEVRSTDFICLTSALSGDPAKGDTITAADGTRYQVQPTNGEKCFRRKVATTTRIHTKRISQ
jgi:hypothetical protein